QEEERRAANSRVGRSPPVFPAGLAREASRLSVLKGSFEGGAALQHLACAGCSSGLGPGAQRKKKEQADTYSVPVASGLIAGNALISVLIILLAALVVAMK
ncbi:hypothetical protein, partial [Haloferula sp. A504]|uniref:hypothetical protein n=1 Tax=Haloferula sp. A504 TaxID=3373601 RepID=UPI0031C2E1C5|nr:hypothetical protein [Verrucomicrobiaceae bacterium E54]